MKTAEFKGVGVAVITPFKEDLTVDFDALGNILNHLVENGSDYIVILGTTGEASLLSFEEKSKIMRFAVNVCKGRIPLVLGYGGCSTFEMIKNMDRYDFEGFEALLTVTPYYIKPSQEGLYMHYKELAGKSPLPIILYNVPGRTGINMLPETTLRLAREVPNLIGIKEASGKIFQIEEILKGRPEGFKVFSGDDALTLHLMSLGADGVISVAANAFPDKVSEMVKHCVNGEMEEARRIHYSMKDLVKNLFVEGNPAGIIYILNKLGFCKNILRLPLTPVSKTTSSALDNILKDVLSDK